jgi:LmbE family N-acetylglucosaminyl deacetylase
MVVAAGREAWQALLRRSAPLGQSDLGGADWLILVPHPDDETLGTGGLIAALAETGNPAWILYLTLGEASHMGAPQWPARRLARVRRTEALGALRILGQPRGRTLYLGWPDGDTPAPGSARFRRAADSIFRFCGRQGVGTVVTTWGGEAHCDHRAAHELARSVRDRSAGSLKLLEYLVWGWTEREIAAAVDHIDPFALDTVRYAERCGKAILQHRTQTTPLIKGARKAFRLPPEMVALAGRAPLILLRGRHAA